MVALVVTIIILLILAAVSIATLTGENGILTQANGAKLQTEIASDKEQLELFYVEEVGNSKYSDVTMDDYLNCLEENGIATKEEDGKYYAEVNGKIYELSIENDELKAEYVESGQITDPKIYKIEIAEKTRNSISIKVEATRMDGGTYYYYIGTDENNFGEADGNNQTGEYTFSNLNQGNEYFIKVVGESKDGKRTEKTISTKIEAIPDATEETIKYTITWKNGVATANFTTTTRYTIETSRDNGNYTRTATVTGLNSGDFVYARLTDGNYSGKEIQITIIDRTKPELSISQTTATTKSINIVATATDSESGVSGQEYKYYIADTAGGYASTPYTTNTTGNCTFDNLEQNTTYYIKVEIEDKAGNKQATETTAQTELIPSAAQAITRTANWNSNGTAQVVLSTGTQFTIQYSKDGNTWTNYTEALTANNGESIYICLTDGRNRGEDYQVKVEDHEGPQVTVSKTATTSNSITVKVDANDTGSGMSADAKYNYYIKANEEKEYRLISGNDVNTAYTFTGLKAQTTYNIKVTTSDVIGNQGEGTVDATTNEFSYQTGNISFSSIRWANKEASIDLTNNTNFQMQYKTILKGQEYDFEEGFETADAKTITIGKLKSGDTVIARLFDGTNTAGYATAPISDTTPPTVTVTGNSEQWTKENITLTVNAQDTESGLQAECYSFDGGTTWQAENTKVYEENTAGIVIKVRDEAGNVATYNTISITKIDKKGPFVNVDTEATSNKITVTITSSTDEGIGMETTPTYTYYLTSNSAELETMTGERSTELTKTYTELKQNTTYYLKIEVQDKLGNVSKTYRTITTGSLDASSTDLKVSDPVWSAKTASVTITNSSTYKMEYQVVKNGQAFDQDGTWKRVETKEETITGLLNKDTIYARLTDGDNVSGTIIKEIKDETAPTVTVDGNSDVWTNQNIILTINAQDDESGLQAECYSFDGGVTWQAGNTKVYENNTAGIVIKVKDEAGNIATYDTIDITKIDKEGPSITIEETETTTKGTTINVTANDAGVGMEATPTYTYYIKKEGEANYNKEIEKTETSHTFKNLKAGTKYLVKIEVQDSLGNIGEQEKEITTKSLLYAVGDITFTEVVWNNGIATVTANNGRTGYDMQYQVVANGGAIDLDGKWTTVTEKTKEITGLKDKDIVYARLTDGVNVTTEYATCNINNPSKQTYTEQELAQNTALKNYDILGISVNSNEIKVQIEEEQEDAMVYSYYYKTINDDEYKLISTNTYHNEPAVITNIKEGSIYKIKVLVTDKSGNVTRCENTATTIALEEAEVNQTYTNNRTYIDDSKELEVRTAGTEETTTLTAGYTVSLPETFKVSEVEGEKKQSEGVVLKDSANNEYVWIPVNDAIYDGVTDLPTGTNNANSRIYKPMAVKQNGFENYYESMVYNFSGILSYRNSSNTGLGKSSYREPSLITNNNKDGYTWSIADIESQSYDAASQYYKDVLGFESSNEFGKYLANSYNNMVTAVDSYGGFYVGRYETTVEETEGNVIVGSKPNSKVLSMKNWYYMNLYQDSQKYAQNPYKNTISVTSSMIWGSQWDSMLNYILKGTDNGKVTTQVGSKKNVPSDSAQDTTDIINNIYDLGSNLYEWTQEATETNYRIYRGGSYDTSASGNASIRRNVVPTDQGPVFGTRLGLYMQSTNDVTGPVSKINKITAKSNSITIEVSAIDKETGVDQYRYYISENGTDWTLVAESDSTVYTYTGLTQNTKYYIKVDAKDGAGNVGDPVQAEQKTEKLGELAGTAITKVKAYGPNGSGIVSLQLDDTYKDSGYYIEYQVLEQGQTLDMNGTWTKGETVTGLSNGQKIYATAFDGTNRTSDYYEETVEGLEEYAYVDSQGKTYTDEQAQSTSNQTSYNTTITYTDSNNQTATIPAGFKVGITSSVSQVNDGLVIQDKAENQYVWVPVENVVETDTSATSTEKAMARLQVGSTNYYEGILYSFSGTTSTKRSAKTVLGTNTYREPTLITSGADYTWNVAKGTAKGLSYDTLEIYYKNMNFGATSGVNVFNSYTEFGQYMNEEYTNMIQSVDKYKGFYVGRYETSLQGTNGNKDAIPQSQISKTPIYNLDWYRDYYYQDSKINSKNPYYSSTSVTSSMVWDSQWSAIMNWMLQDDKSKEFVTKVTGNHTGTRATTGSFATDLAKNIFDLSSNVTEWTQGGQSTSNRNRNGGYCVTENDTYIYTASTLAIRGPTDANTNSSVISGVTTYPQHTGSRMALYINDTTDTTAPSIEVAKVTKQTNSIEVTVNAEDEESGIDKYQFSISYKDFKDSSFTESDILKTVPIYGRTYTFEGLTQNQVYYIKVEVINGAGKSAVCYTGSIKTDILDIQEGAIVRKKVYGKDGQGTAYFEISNTNNFEQQGYYLQYQIDKTKSGYQENGTWTKGGTATGLSVGDVVYTRLYDGVNLAGYYMTTNITELETFSETYTKTTAYEDYDIIPNDDGTSDRVLVGTAYIPAGFKRATSSITNKIANGLVIEDEKGNQYVWIPVDKDKVVYDGETAISATYKPMVRYQTGSSSSTANQYFESIYYGFSGTTSTANITGYGLGKSGYREPSLVTNSTANYSWSFTAGNNYDATNYDKLSELGITSATQMGVYMNNNYTAMIQSIAKYGGYYVGRYETSIFTENGENDTNGTKGNIVKSIPNATPMASINWYKMYLCQDSNYANNPYHNSSSVTSQMITGSQWDTMLNFVLKGTDKEKVTAVTGNHTGSRAATGKFGSDIMNNIFDLSSNVLEWTQEAHSSCFRVTRGGNCPTTDFRPSSYRIYSAPTSTNYYVGSRLSLYLK